MESETITMTYRQLADRLGVSKEAAKSRARRAGWPRVVDNTGVARFNVPASLLEEVHDESEQALSEVSSISELECTSEAIRVLRECLREMSDQLKRKDKEIERLQLMLISSNGDDF